MSATPFALPLLPTSPEQASPWGNFGKFEHLANGALTRLDGMMVASSKPDLFWLTWLAKEAQSSNVIEGTVTTLDEVLGTSSRKRFDNKFDSFAESEQPLSRVDFLPIR